MTHAPTRNTYRQKKKPEERCFVEKKKSTFSYRDQ